jgi:2,4-dienoyl-CoA reductase-like NADH-dependent reductase (Old Yellow Enzyme family)
VAGTDRKRHERFDFPDRSALEAKIRALDLEIPLSDEIGILFSPVEIAGRTVPNRFVVHPMEGADANDRGAPGVLTFRRYERFAAGGSGVVWFEATAVNPAFRSNPRQLVLAEENVDAFRDLVRRARRAAAHGNALLILQLTHPGRFCKPDPVIAQHNPVLDRLRDLPGDYPLVTDEELDRLQDDYLRAARRAARAGFDGVDIKACHGYLVSELLASHTREDSRYGGGFENRARFLLEVIKKIQSDVPELIVTSRITALDGLRSPYGFIDEAEVLMKRLEQAGCPLVNMSLGIPYHNPHFGRPYNTVLKGGMKPNEHPLVGVERLINAAAAVQRAAPGTPVVGTGYSWLRQFFPHAAAAAVRDRKATLIGLGRTAFAFPDWVKHLEEHGDLPEDRLCIGCSACSQLLRDGLCAGCIVRDVDVYLPIYKQGNTGGLPPHGN